MLNIKILFFIKKSKLLKKGEAPIYLRLTIDGRREEISTKRSILPTQWNPEPQCARGNSRDSNEINLFIEYEKGKINQVIRQLEQKNIYFDARTIMNRKTVVNIFLEYLNIEESKESREILSRYGSLVTDIKVGG